MKTQDIFIETPVFIEIEGNEVLRFIEKDEHCVRYGIVGFPDEQVKLLDYRTKGLEAIDKVLSTERLEQFPEDFCFPSSMRLLHQGQETLIELFNLQSVAEPELMLWIATNLEEPIPDYKYQFFRVEPMADSSYSFISLFNYRRFQSYFEGMTDQILLQMQAEN